MLSQEHKACETNKEKIIEAQVLVDVMSDCLTKHVSKDDIEWQLRSTGQYVTSGRHNMCPEVV